MENNLEKALDFVGDIHGNAYKLKLLLDKLGYLKTENEWKHPENRKLVILGDFINAGFESKEVLSLLKELWTAKLAYILLGNHEYYLAWNYFRFGKEVFKKGSSLEKDYQRFLSEFRDDENLLIKYCDWIYNLPLFLENDYFRAVHAYWSRKNDKILKKYSNLKELWGVFDNMKKKKAKKIRKAISETLSGKMAVFFDPCRMEKPEQYRVKWWRNNLYGKNLADCIQTNQTIKCPSVIVDSHILPDFEPYSENEKPVFFGHYWLQTLPCLLRNNACCLDFGAAKGGYLTAYRWNGEKILNANNLCWV